MNPQQINLGNLIISPKGELIKVKSIDFDELYSEAKEYFVNGYALKECTGLKITQKKLAGLGFKHADNKNEDMFFEIQKDTGVECQFLIWFWFNANNEPVFFNCIGKQRRISHYTGIHASTSKFILQFNWI